MSLPWCANSFQSLFLGPALGHLWPRLLNLKSICTCVTRSAALRTAPGPPSDDCTSSRLEFQIPFYGAAAPPKCWHSRDGAAVSACVPWAHLRQRRKTPLRFSTMPHEVDH